jgi:hypothetical protein
MGDVFPNLVMGRLDSRTTLRGFLFLLLSMAWPELYLS